MFRVLYYKGVIYKPFPQPRWAVCCSKGNFLKFSMKMLAIIDVTGDPMAGPSTCS